MTRTQGFWTCQVLVWLQWGGKLNHSQGTLAHRGIKGLLFHWSMESKIKDWECGEILVGGDSLQGLAGVHRRLTHQSRHVYSALSVPWWVTRSLKIYCITCTVFFFLLSQLIPRLWVATLCLVHDGFCSPSVACFWCSHSRLRFEALTWGTAV